VIGTVEEAYPLGVADQLSPSRIRALAETDALKKKKPRGRDGRFGISRLLRCLISARAGITTGTCGALAVQIAITHLQSLEVLTVLDVAATAGITQDRLNQEGGQ
jgi:hypothetical protein